MKVSLLLRFNWLQPISLLLMNKVMGVPFRSIDCGITNKKDVLSEIKGQKINKNN